MPKWLKTVKKQLQYLSHFCETTVFLELIYLIKSAQRYIYNTLTFQHAGSQIDSNTCSIYVALVQVAGTTLSIFIIDKIGRRVLLIVSDLFMAITLIGLGIFFHLRERLEDDGCLEMKHENCSDAVYGVTREVMDAMGLMPLITLMVYVMAFSLGFGPIPWIMNAELFSREAQVSKNKVLSTYGC